jgi:hypothetical protein
MFLLAADALNRRTPPRLVAALDRFGHWLLMEHCNESMRVEVKCDSQKQSCTLSAAILQEQEG